MKNNISDEALKERLVNCTNGIRVPEEVKARALAIPELTNQPRGNHSAKRTLLCAAAAVMACLMLISATLICKTLFFVPGTGLVQNRLLEVYATLEPVVWGKTTLEAVIRYDDTETGKSTLTIFFDGVMSSPLTAITDDGEAVTLDCNYVNTHNSRTITCEDFPKADKFTLSMGYKETNVTLYPVDGTKYAEYEWPELEGVKLIVYPLNSTNTIFAREIELDGFAEKYGLDSEKLSAAFGEYSCYGSDGEIYRAGSTYGNICRVQCPDGVTIERIAVDSISVCEDFDFYPDENGDYKDPPICKMTIPEDGGEYVFPEDTVLFELAGKRYAAKKVTRSANELTLEYISEAVPDSEAALDYQLTYILPTLRELKQYGGGGGSEKDGSGSTTWTIKKKNAELLAEYTGKEITLGMMTVHLQLNGSWIIEFL